MKRIISIVVVVVMLLTALPLSGIDLFTGLSAQAITEDEFSAKLNELRSTYPNYSTWTGTYGDGTQCYGFARLVADYVFGGSFKTWSTIYSISGVKVGDILQYGNTSGSGHTVFVTAVSGDTIYFVDCNGNGNYSGGTKVRTCGVKWDNTITKSALMFGEYSFSYLLSSPNLDSDVTQVEPLGCLSQWETKWKDYYYNKGNLYDTGCGIFSLVNAVGYLTGQRMDVVSVANWAYGIRAYNVNGAEGTYRGVLYPNVQNKYGAEYGFTLDCGSDNKGYWSTSANKTLKNHLSNGGVAIAHVDSHFIALVNYDYASNKFHVFDSAPSTERGTKINNGDVWLTESALATGRMDVDWFCLLSRTNSVPPAMNYWSITNADNSDTGIDVSDTPTLSGTYKFWFKKYLEDENYYVNIYLDNEILLDHGAVDSDGYVSVTIDTAPLTQGVHTVTAELCHTNGTHTVKKDFIVDNMIRFHALTNPDNSDSGIDIGGIPTLNGEYKFWFKKILEDKNHYINIYLDDALVLDHGSADSDGYVSVIIDTAPLVQGTHTITVELCHTNGTHTVKKDFIVDNMIRFHALTNPDNSDSGVDVGGTPTLNGEYKFWFKKILEDENHYVNIYLDDKLVLEHDSVDSDGYVSIIIDTAALKQGKHTVTAELCHTDGTHIVKKEFLVDSIIRFHGFTNPDNTTIGIDPHVKPTLSNRVRFWFADTNVDNNYYINIYLDDNIIKEHIEHDENGYSSVVINMNTIPKGYHKIKAVLVHTNGESSVTKGFYSVITKNTVTFNANGGESSTPSMNVTYGLTYGTLPIPTRSGYIFNGWYTAATGGKEITEDTLVTITEDHTLYAQWTQIAVSSISIKTNPADVSYCVGENLNTSGLTLTATYNDGSTKTISSGFSCSPTTLNTVSAQKITVTYSGKTTTFNVAVNTHTEKTTTTNASCETAGKKVVTCTVCGAKISETTISAVGHTIVNDKAVAPTCVTTGLTEGSHCSVCNKVIKAQTTVPALGHKYNSVVTPPTESSEGFTTYTCGICSHTYISDYTGMLDKSYELTGTVKSFLSDTDEITVELIKSGETSVLCTSTVVGNSTTFAFGGIKAGEYTLKISKKNHVTREYSVTIKNINVSVEVQLNLLGDINGDGKVNVADYSKILRHTKKTETLTEYNFNSADVNSDGKITVSDYAKVLRHVKKTEALW